MNVDEQINWIALAQCPITTFSICCDKPLVSTTTELHSFRLKIFQNIDL